MVAGDVIVRDMDAGAFRSHEGSPVGLGGAVPPADADMLPRIAILVPEADTRLQRDLLPFQENFDSCKLPAAGAAGGFRQRVARQVAALPDVLYATA